MPLYSLLMSFDRRNRHNTKMSSRGRDRYADRPVYIGNFEYDASSREIEKLCDRYGDLERVDMKTGFAFVYFRNPRDAEDAVRSLDGREFGYKRRRLRVEWSKGDGDIKRREDTRKRNIKPTSTLFVVNFNVEDTRERDLEKYFEKYGRLTRVQIKRTYAFVQYEEVHQAEAAMKETHLSRFMGRTISVEYVCKEPEGGRSIRSPPRSPRGGERYASRSRSPYRRPRSRSPSYGRDSPVRRDRSLSRSPVRSPARSVSRSRSRSRSKSRVRSLSP